jgi:hypothetical protein
MGCPLDWTASRHPAPLPTQPSSEHAVKPNGTVDSIPLFVWRQVLPEVAIPSRIQRHAIPRYQCRFRLAPFPQARPFELGARRRRVCANLVVHHPPRLAINDCESSVDMVAFCIVPVPSHSPLDHLIPIADMTAAEPGNVSVLQTPQLACVEPRDCGVVEAVRADGT